MEVAIHKMEVTIHKKTTIYLTTFAQNFYCLNTAVSRQIAVELQLEK